MAGDRGNHWNLVVRYYVLSHRTQRRVTITKKLKIIYRGIEIQVIILVEV